MLVSAGHTVLVHGRSPAKLEKAAATLAGLAGGGSVETYVSDLSRMEEVNALAAAVTAKHPRLDALINNAGVYSVPEAITPAGLDVRFVVNTVAPYLLAQQLLPALGTAGRVVNVSSAAQSPVDAAALTGEAQLSDDAAYAQSKLALTMWSRHMALSLEKGPVVVAVNPGSLLGSKMVKDAYGIAGGDIQIGADILSRAALSDEFATASGKYFDNDSGQFADPHADALDTKKSAEIVRLIESLLAGKLAG